MIEVTLPSGAILKIGTIPWPEALALNESVVEELKDLEIKAETEMLSLYKSLFCTGFSSQKIKIALWKCMGRCTYNCGSGDLKIDQTTFEPEESRQDYIQVCMEVAKAACFPFVKAHSAEFSQILENLKSSLGSKLKKTRS